MTTLTLYTYNSDTRVAQFNSRFDPEICFTLANVTSAQALFINNTIREMENAAYQASLAQVERTIAAMRGYAPTLPVQEWVE